MSEHEQQQDQAHLADRARPLEPPAPEVAPAERVASAVGNQAFSALATQGSGILPDGRVHPDVESTIARTRGGGGELDTSTRERLGPGLGDSLADVRVHTDDTADALAGSVSARAFATGTDVYFARGQYQPSSTEGDRLLAHELTHVVQQRDAPSAGPLVVSEPGNALENEADAVADDLLG
jgi:hypothetical protein